MTSGVALLLALVLTLVLALVLAYRWGAAGVDDAGPPVGPSPSPSRTEPPTTAEIVTALAPSVVTVEASRGEGRGSLGTGVVANQDGTVLTAYHVVRGARAIRLIFADGTSTSATTAGTDRSHDIATLTPAQLPGVVVPAVLGGGVAVGDQVVAIGNQLGLIGSTTTGVVSGLGRATRGEDRTELDGLIQFDAAVNRGSSGGPLLNARGQVVGVVVALADPSGEGTFVGVGFAVPIGQALGPDGNGPRGPQV